MESLNIQESRESIRAFGDLLYKAPQIYEELYKEIGYRDRQVADITHDIEFLDLDKESGYRKAIELKENRQARRTAKEIMEFVKILKSFNETHPNLVLDIQELLNTFDSVIDEQSKRVYTPKENKGAKCGQKHFRGEIDRQLSSSED
jgi:hypothetical protein